MLRRFLSLLVVLAFASVAVSAAMPQAKPPASPAAEATVTIAGKVITIKYSAPSVRGRDVFGAVITKDKTYPVWRTGANSATSLVTDADLQIKGLAVPKGSYTLYTQINEQPWQFIVNKQTGQWGLTYNKDQDLGRVVMDMGKPPAPVETMKITLTATGANSGKLEIAWDNTVASVPFTVK